jgi:predicted heme/steroid binding protein
MKSISRYELAHCDGREGRPAYVAYHGKVYDVSDSFLWKGGRHQAMHDAGMDLADILDQAPHGPDLLERVPVVGVLSED